MLHGMKPLGRLRRMLHDLDGRFKPGQEWKLEVTNERGVPIYAIYIRADQSNDPSANGDWGQ